MKITIREARPEDIREMHQIRMTVRENALNDPSRVTEKDYIPFLTTRGKGWVGENQNEILGFCIVDTDEKNVWALFVRPGFERMGVGQQLHRVMMDWYFLNYSDTIWLGTAPGTRAEAFYRRAGWKPTGLRPNGELRLEMSGADWADPR